MDFRIKVKKTLIRSFGSTRKEIHYSVYIISLTLMGIGLPVSRSLVSLSLLSLSLNWLIEGDFRRKLHVFITRKSLLFICSIYFVHIIGLIYTNDFGYAFYDLRKKVPLLAIPLIVGTTQSISAEKVKNILKYFIATVFIATLISTIDYLFTNSFILDTRHISVFISHIRFSLMIIISILISIYMILYNGFQVTRGEKKALAFAAIWFSGFLFILQSFTGIWIFILSVPILLLNWTFRQKKLSLIFGVSTILLIGLVIILSIFFKALKKFYPIPKINIENLDQYTVNGRPYKQYPNSKILENGNFVHLYICEDELRDSWNTRSNLNYDSTDYKGQELKETLIRYLTSKGLRKDSLGVASLNEKDIRMIENGYSNYIYGEKFSIYPRIYQFLWELDVYRKTGISGGHSLTQRIEYQKNGIEIIKRNFWIGVGTGDVKTAYDKQYKISNSKLEEKWRLRAHNQLLTFFITFGIIGFAWILFSYIFAVIYEKKHKDLLTMLFLLVAFVSMFNEDTLETHVGICFFSFFFAIFVFGYTRKISA